MQVSPTTRKTWENSAATNSQEMYLGLVGTILDAALEDRLIPGPNPARAKSVSTPTGEQYKVRPWTEEQVADVHDYLNPRYQLLVTLGAGLGLRQGEIFGLALEDIDRDKGLIHVRRQVKDYPGNRLVFDLPKYRKTRDVPLPDDVLAEIDAYVDEHPTREVTLPWHKPDSGERRTANILVTTREAGVVNKNYFMNAHWWKAVGKAGLDNAAGRARRVNGMHMLRHWYASTLLDSGETIRAVAENLGHSDPAFTLRTYTHLMPTSTERTKSAINAAFKRGRSRQDEAEKLAAIAS